MIDIKVDTKNLDNAMKEYLIWNKRAIADLVNATALSVAITSVGETYAPTKDQIKEDLMTPSNVDGRAPLASIIINKNRKAKGQKGLSGSAMAIEMKTFIENRQKKRNFLRSGWLRAVKVLRNYVRGNTSGKVPRGIKLDDASKGGAIAAKPNDNWKSTSVIFNNNSANGSHESLTQGYLKEGLQSAIDKVATNRMEYVARKKLEEGFSLFSKWCK